MLAGVSLRGSRASQNNFGAGLTSSEASLKGTPLILLTTIYMTTYIYIQSRVSIRLFPKHSTSPCHRSFIKTRSSTSVLPIHKTEPTTLDGREPLARPRTLFPSPAGLLEAISTHSLLSNHSNLQPPGVRRLWRRAARAETGQVRHKTHSCGSHSPFSRRQGNKEAPRRHTE